MSTPPDDEAPPTAEELRDAEALARTLDGAPTEPGVRAEAEAAALLRASARPASLSPQREEALGRDLAGAVRAERRRPRWAVRLGALASIASVAALLLVVFTLGKQAAPASARPTALPEPGEALLRARVRAGRSDTQAQAALEVEMRAYRGQVYAALSQRYGGAP